ncbi:PAS domain S-box protein [Lysobacter sp. F6437]|uniref:PAS domain S-box protein n=1 Tax=Lysobacter sp. F6437 TaxID=3459296 RepID=UPI00403E1C8B
MPPVPAHQPGDDCFRLAMAASGIGMAIVDLDRRWVEVNPAFERMFGYSADELVGRPAAEFTHPDDIERSRQALDDLVAGRIEFIDAPKRYLHRDGKTIWAHANVAVMRDAGGVPLLLLVQVRDVSAEREAGNVLRANAEARANAADASDRHLQMFADSVAHDLRAPLRSIESFSGLLAKRAGEQLDETGRDYLERIRNAASRMSSLLAALADLSHATRVELKPGPVDLSLLADWVLADLQEAEPGRVVRAQVQPGLLAHGDERLLKLLLEQLLHNAWKFAQGRSEARIEVGGSSDAGGVQLFVRDNGSGFDMRYAPKLFQPFQRLHGPDEGGGHGLGLAIAQRIAERHHGYLRAESEPDVGSTFHLDLPAGDGSSSRAEP